MADPVALSPETDVAAVEVSNHRWRKRRRANEEGRAVGVGDSMVGLCLRRGLRW